jgi:hypothetical protein
MFHIVGGIVGTVFFTIVFCKISSKAGYPWWYGLGMFVPLVNVFVIIAFAFSEWPIEMEMLDMRLRDPQHT